MLLSPSKIKSTFETSVFSERRLLNPAFSAPARPKALVKKRSVEENANSLQLYSYGEI